MRYALVALGAGLVACSSPQQAGPPEWSEAFDASQLGWFLNVWGPAEDDLYAAGGVPDAGVIMHFDGATWEPLDLGLSVPLLTWSYGFGPADITTVGMGGTIIHFDGTSWTVQDTPTIEDLWGVWGATPDDLWVVGGRGRGENQATLLHFDGEAWSQVEIPPLERANVFALFKVFGLSADNVYVVGQNGVVLHFNGEAWSEELSGASDDLVSVWATGPDNVVAVGGRGSGLVSRWNGVEWHTENMAPLPGFNGVWMQREGVAHVVGVDATLLRIDLDTLEAERSFVPALHDFHSVFSATGQRIVAVGGNLLATSGPFEGVAFERSLSPEE